jgi:flagellar biosynthesis/type III secretory pathway M-ring protein FliF/YscJ
VSRSLGFTFDFDDFNPASTNKKKKKTETKEDKWVQASDEEAVFAAVVALFLTVLAMYYQRRRRRIRRELRAAAQVHPHARADVVRQPAEDAPLDDAQGAGQ